MPDDTLFSALLNQLNARSSSTRIEDGRIIPAHRFQLNPGSLRGAMANVDVSDREETRAVSSTGAHFVMSEIRHPILKSIQIDPGLALLGTDRVENGPILTASGGMILRDRGDPNLRWVKRAFEVPNPADSAEPVFRARKSGTAIDGTDMWAADLTLPVRLVRLAATERQIALALKRDPRLEFRDIPMVLREATLKLPYQSPEGRQVMELQGRVAGDKGSVTFNITGDAISLAWKLLRETDEARVQFLSDHVAYEAIEQPAPEPEAVADGDGDTANDPGFFHVGRLAKLFGGRVRRADISASRRIAREGVEPIAISPKAKRFNILKDRAARIRAAHLGAAKVARAPKLDTIVYAKQRMVTDIVHMLDFRGSDKDRLFVMTDPVTRRDIRITRPPWSAHGAIRELEELDGFKLGLPPALATRLTIFASLVDVGVYIVVPDVYVLGREPETGALQLFAEVISDPMIPENSVVRVTIGLVPEVQPDEEVVLRAALEAHLRQTLFATDTPPAPKLRYPTDLGTLPDLSWGDPLTEASQPIIDGRTVLLTLTTNKLGFAKAVFDTLTRRNQVIGGQLAFGIPDARSARVSLLIGLTRTSGPTLRTEMTSGGAVLTDLCGHPQRVTGLVRPKSFGAVQTLNLSPPVDLEPGAMEQAQPDGLEPGAWTAASQVLYPEVVPLDPKRINVDELVTSVIFTTALEQGAVFGGTGLQSLTIEASLPGQEPLAVVMNPRADTGFFEAQIVRLALPFDQALSSTGRVLDYRITAMFADGSRFMTDWRSQDFGANPDISITREMLTA
ncbi:hypothetical protein [uncultured Tateyamaria sp.]|uniref:hypothetical protein n=1 Tax=Tateyamaria sp. 1078 TaxID=3417464 RepID=UPI00260C5E02|nr:hypothetical protein [uncultured Tateyamaria sp.]